MREKFENMSIGSSSRAHAVDELKKSKKAHEKVLGPKMNRNKFKNSNKTKPNVSCHVCSQSGHYTSDCRHRKGQTKKLMQLMPVTIKLSPP